ncbi:hypothetical protein L249_6577 [Ophiocordyceps polyrhachis-furcata BCC 54312]|uniref:ribonuclease Z n=1 Tax=Ophiocordyceps polyrhachis-furcata BCC 54312 TaxID=1330021 RepID=A0A367LKF1_9HYPO|nr:hypothetical protein L249_6577 [Ophiocordyceps polyrhachis-furcata BCC 54312]
MTSTVELISVPSADTPGTCIWLHHEKRAYVFGRLTEGTQRSFGSRKVNFGSTEHIFLTGPVCWDNVGGLFGYMLSLATMIDSAQSNQEEANADKLSRGLKPLKKQAKYPGLVIHGGENLAHILAACRPAVWRQTLRVSLSEHRTDPRLRDKKNMEPDFSDDVLSVWKIPVQGARSGSPPKRTHDSQEKQKPASTFSDPGPASMIFEGVMFNGRRGPKPTVRIRRVRDVKPGDLAFISHKGVLRSYKPGDGDAKEPDPDTVAWVRDQTKQDEQEKEADNRLLRLDLPPTSYSQTAMSYIVKCHDRRGKFDAPAAAALGVHKTKFKLLTGGESVPGKDGMTVTPDMVLGSPLPGNGVVIADIPSPDYVDGFIQRPEWEDAELMSNMMAMYWILGPGLSSDRRILDFVRRQAHTRHVFCADDTCPNMISHGTAAALHVKLRAIDRQRFPLSVYDNTVSYPSPAPDSPLQLGRAGSASRLMPSAVHDIKLPAPFVDLSDPCKDIGDKILRLAKAARKETSSPAFLARVEAENRDLPNPDAEIVPLGTGSSVPGTHRNVSGTLVHVPGIGAYIFDCGEGTLGQMKRALGEAQTKSILSQLRCIVISHLHADHHIGLVSLIGAWYAQTLADSSSSSDSIPPTLAISCISRHRLMLKELSQVQDFGYHRLRFPNCPPSSSSSSSSSSSPSSPPSWDITDSDHETNLDPRFGLRSITRIPVNHCWRSYATQLELSSGLRIAYSGDCRPSADFASRCKGADLLIHECTFGDDPEMLSHAIAKKHSTMSEALRVADQMQAKRTLLTHFSQRYVKADVLKASRRNDVVMAFDMMRLRLGDFQAHACYAAAIQALMESLGTQE